MKKFLESRPGQILLLIIVIIVWGSNAFQFSDVFTNKEVVAETNLSTIDFSELESLTKNEFTYSNNGRDPFRLNIKPGIRQQESPNIIEAEEYQRPKLAILGIMDNTVVVMTELRKVMVLKESEEVGGISVESITPDSVIFSHQNKKFVLKMYSTSL